MIKLFGITDTDYTTNGDKVIIPLKAKIHKEDNGSFYLELETDISYVDDLTDGRIIVANTPQGDQAFRIGNVEKTKTKIQLKAWHVFYDSKNYVIQDSYVVDKNCNDALDHLNSATDNPSPFSTLSDVGVIDSYRCVRKSLYEAINTVIQRWGGHLVRDNWNISIMNSVGADNGVVVPYIHTASAPNMGKIGVLVALTGADTATLQEVGKKVAMHIAAASPRFRAIDEVDADTIAHEKGIYAEQAKNSGKPAAIIEKMVEGRLRKFYEEVVVLEQAFIMDPDKKVKEILAGSKAELTAFVRFGLGEGIEKKEEDFAAEVAKQING